MYGLLNLERLRLLRLVGMLTACKHVQLPEHARPSGFFGSMPLTANSITRSGAR